MLRKIKLYGELAKFVGHREFEVKADTLSHAVSFLINNFAGVEEYMSPKYYQVKIGNYAIDENEIQHPIGQEDIHFIPVIQGAGRGLGKILLGGALIALSFGVGGVFANPLAFGAKGFVSDMLFPVPEMPEFSSEQDPRISFNFAGTQQTSRAGTPVPVVYGEIFTGSVVISGAVDTEQVQA